MDALSQVSAIVAEAAAWAHGCDQCSYGILMEPVGLERWAGSAIYLRRAYGWKLGETVFCDCRAGHMQRQYARRMWDLHGDEDRLGRARQAISQPPDIHTVARVDSKEERLRETQRMAHSEMVRG